LRRLIAWGGAVGLIAGLVAQAAVAYGNTSEIVSLARLAMLIPFILYMLWWAIGPGVGIDNADRLATSIDTEPEQDDMLERRMAMIERSFDEMAVPRPHRVARMDAETNEHDVYRASLRRVAMGETDDAARAESFGVKRPKSA
jgi:hypothetical protein